MLIVEGETERAFLPFLRDYIATRLAGNMPKLSAAPYDGRIPTHEKLRRLVNNLLQGPQAADCVVALTDVYTGSVPPLFVNADDAKDKMRHWVGLESRFYPHVAQHDFEAWLLPYWPTIQKLAGHNRTAPSGNPESVNHNHPPANRIKELFQVGKSRSIYIKPRDAARILRDNDLSVTVNQCPELRSLIDTIVRVSNTSHT